jgi:hypothetical protein
MHSISIDPIAKIKLVEYANERTKVMNASRKNYHAMLRPDQELLGVVVEWAFVQFYGSIYGIEMNWNAHKYKKGDGGIDYTINQFGIDVKYTQSNYRYMTSGEAAVRADLLVYIEYDKKELVTAVGWEFGEIMRKAPMDDFGGKGIPTHCRPKSLIRKMDDFDKLLVVGKQVGYTSEQYMAMISPKRILIKE